MQKYLSRWFGFDAQTMSVKKEIIGGITTFLTMAYILAVNPAILADAGMDKGAVFTATVVSAVIATLVMAIYAKLPFALAPGMGLNAFFAYTIVIAMGYSWQFALTAVFIEGLLFILLTVTGIREQIVRLLPAELRKAISPGIGLFLAFIGLNNAGMLVTNTGSLPMLSSLCSPAAALTCFGIVVTIILLIKNVMGAMLIGIVVTALVGIPLGLTHFGGIVDTPPSMAPICLQLQWDGIFSMDMLICVATLLFLDIFDTIGSLVGVCNRAGMVDEQGNIPRLGRAFMADAIGTTMGALLGTSTVTTFVESASGVNAGGRSGLTAFTTAICFAVALLLSPLFLAIPPQATASALILVGVMMMQDIRKVDFTKLENAIPSFMCVSMMAFTSSISDGIMLGLIAYVLIRIAMRKWQDLNVGMCILTALFILRYIFL
ncbi:MAG: NCS2 family permease [Paludibacteraceae bacterium]|nr:NCS2 family permease [Paludibacteraceae bacterium]